jgi:hypothetical protein
LGAVREKELLAACRVLQVTDLCMLWPVVTSLCRKAHSVWHSTAHCSCPCPCCLLLLLLCSQTLQIPIPNVTIVDHPQLQVRGSLASKRNSALQLAARHSMDCHVNMPMSETAPQWNACKRSRFNSCCLKSMTTLPCTLMAKQQLLIF